ncbi:MAG: Asp-tRNA(Asn)/Glu-tRNA(Gln) amidotransferase subunit GatA [Candidatus Krumholzibacteria bacterium]
MGLNSRGLVELTVLLKKGEISPLDVAKDVVAAVEEKDGDVHAYVEFYKEDLLERAAALTKSGDYRSTPLAGLPIAVKDNICVEGRATTAGSRILSGYTSPYTATAAANVLRSGGIICGKTNLDEFAMGSSTENSAFGPSRNPWNLDYAPGGSSGGSAAAVAADMAVGALGSDTGGSIRQPAGFCGVVGMKPTYGRVSRYGLIAFASSLDQIGPFARSVEDCAVLLGAISSGDAQDATSLRAPVPDFARDLDKGLDGLTVGIPRDFMEMGTRPEVEENLTTLCARLEKENVAVVDVSLAHARYACACYYVIANAEASSNLARFDGVRYGHRTEHARDVYSMYTHTRDEGFGDEVKRRILLGTYVLSAGYYDAYYLKAQKVRSLIIRDFQNAFDHVDLIMMPTAPSAAFPIGEKVSDPLLMYLSDIFTIPVNLAGLPAIAIPSGVAPDGLPLGVQLIGKPLEENTVLRGARGVERLVDFERKTVV